MLEGQGRKAAEKGAASASDTARELKQNAVDGLEDMLDLPPDCSRSLREGVLLKLRGLLPSPFIIHTSP